MPVNTQAKRKVIRRDEQALFPDAASTAVLSDCGRYRYQLARVVGSSPRTIAFFGVNPSTADASIDDATVRKWRGFAQRLGFGRFVVGNVFAWRATDVKELGDVADPIGPENDQHIGQIIQAADLLVPCWGAREKLSPWLRPRLDELLGRLKGTQKPVAVFGLTKLGDPLHPLMLGYGVQLVRVGLVKGWVARDR
jgi:hypothetical protein